MANTGFAGALGEAVQVSANSPTTRTEDVYGAIVNNNASLNSILSRLDTVKASVLGSEPHSEQQSTGPREAANGTLNMIGDAIDYQVDVISKIADVVTQLESL